MWHWTTTMLSQRTITITRALEIKVCIIRQARDASSGARDPTPDRGHTLCTRLPLCTTAQNQSLCPTSFSLRVLRKHLPRSPYSCVATYLLKNRVPGRRLLDKGSRLILCLGARRSCVQDMFPQIRGILETKVVEKNWSLVKYSMISMCFAKCLGQLEHRIKRVLQVQTQCLSMVRAPLTLKQFYRRDFVVL